MQFTKQTPNLFVSDMERSLHFYCSVLEFTRTITVPDQPPFIFAAVSAGSVEIFLNVIDYASIPEPRGATSFVPGSITLFIEMEGLAELHARIIGLGIPLAQPLEDKFYGMREFGVADPDGVLLTFAERIPAP
jgi:lactoylglutathione lyase